jgi:zinc D-Ala-D-Ala carboxypeptidase
VVKWILSKLFRKKTCKQDLSILSKHFTRREFEKSYTATRLGIDNAMPDVAYYKAKQLCEEVLEPCRRKFGVVVVNSGYRSAELNRAIKGAKKSQHMKGEAADIELPKGDNWKLLMYIKDNLDYDQLIAENMIKGDPNAGWVHVSYRVGHNRNEALSYKKGKYTKLRS